MTTILESHDLASPARVEMRLPGFRQPAAAELSRPNKTAPPAQLPRVARLMALAIKLQEMVSRGEVRDYAQLACVGYVSRARITQVMNLLLLAPDIQERLLFHDSADPQLRGLTERHFRMIAKIPDWACQRMRFEQYIATTRHSTGLAQPKSTYWR